ncbi:MAG TPA: CDP-alcohol phosphatidyltransferase family protein [Kofleriaceae bacterium]
MGRFRYYLPSAVTIVGIAFAAIAVQRAVEGQYRTAAWWAMYCLLTDNIDGAIARRLRASSPFGAQLDSFADFFSFGVAPATVFYAFFASTPGAGWSDPVHRGVLSLLVLLLITCVAIRLARFNVTHSVAGAKRFFVGWPTTYIGGMLAALFTLALKYGDPAWAADDPGGDQLRLFGDVRLDGMMRLLPWLLLPASLVMISKLRMPRAALTGRRWVDILLAVTMVVGYGLGLARRLPEYLVAGGVVYMAISLRYHLISRGASPLPPLFPADDR